MDCSLPGSSIHGIFQTRVLEWGAIAFSSNYIYIHVYIIIYIGFQGGAVVKDLPANAGDTRDVGLIPGREEPLEKEMATRSGIVAGKSHGQRSLVGYSP